MHRTKHQHEVWASIHSHEALCIHPANPLISFIRARPNSLPHPKRLNRSKANQLSPSTSSLQELRLNGLLPHPASSTSETGHNHSFTSHQQAPEQPPIPPQSAPKTPLLKPTPPPQRPHHPPILLQQHLHLTQFEVSRRPDIHEPLHRRVDLLLFLHWARRFGR